jgi:hypothetical protein
MMSAVYETRFQNLQSLINTFNYSEKDLMAWKSWNPDKHSFNTRISGDVPRSQVNPGREKGFSFIMVSKDPALRCHQFDSTGFRVRFPFTSNLYNLHFYNGVDYLCVQIL